MNEFLAVDELSQYLGIKKSSLYSMVEKREIPFYKIGRLVRFRKADIDAWAEGLKFEVVSPQAEARKIIDQTTPEIGYIVKKNLASTQISPRGIDELVKKAIEQARAEGYTNSGGKPDRIKGRRKEVEDGAL